MLRGIVAEPHSRRPGTSGCDATDAQASAQLQHASATDEVRFAAQSRGERAARGPEVPGGPAREPIDRREHADTPE